MHPAINALVLIDRVLTEEGIRPIEEKFGIDMLGKSHITHEALDWDEVAETFNWSLCLTETKEEGGDEVTGFELVAGLEYSAQVTPDGESDFDFFPAITIGYRASSGLWFMEFDHHDYGGPSPVATVAVRIGFLEDETLRILTEADAVAAMRILAKYVKWHQEI